MSDSPSITSTPLMPVVFLPHGGGPLPLLDDPGHRPLIHFMREQGSALPKPTAILMISAHWEEKVASVSSSLAPGMIYDYHGFPPESYEFQYPAPGSPDLANSVLALLQAADIPARLDPERGFDHGTFVPLMLMYPEAKIPVVQLSLLANLDPASQIALGKAIAPLREQGVLILGSGMSFHNMRAFFSAEPDFMPRSEKFDQWLSETLTDTKLSFAAQEERLLQWQGGPQARFSHPREEHLLPLLVCFGASSNNANHAQKIFAGKFMNTWISAFLWA